MATNLPRMNMLLGKGLLLITLPSLPKLLMYSILKSLEFLRKDPSMRWAQYKGSMIVHTLQYQNIREFLTSGDLF